MFKGVLKNLFGFALAAAPLAAFIMGTNAFLFNFRDKLDTQKEKATLIDQFAITSEYKEEIKTAKLESEEAAEKLVMTYAGEEVQTKISKLNQVIEDFEEEEKKGIIMIASSVVLCVPLGINGMKLMTYGDSKLELTEDAEYYLNKPVIE